MILDSDLASRLARIALGHVTREYPHKLDHVMERDEDALPPRLLHPIFFGSFDWHSCVHGWWTLLTLRRLFPEMVEAAEIGAVADESFTTAKVAAELAYLGRASSRGFERPYGWAWLLYLHLEASRHEPAGWAKELEPLVRAFADRLQDYMTVLTYPIRAGTHFNTAFALTLAHEWAAENDEGLAERIRSHAAGWFARDVGCQAWEPSGDDFLSPALIEALCMASTQPRPTFATWFGEFLPQMDERLPATLFAPAIVSDRSDGKIAHLDGLNLSRAWSWRRLATMMPHRQRAIAEEAAAVHLAAALSHVAGDYAGEHWLASFALLALMAGTSR